MADTANKKQLNVLVGPETLKLLKMIQDHKGKELGFTVSAGDIVTMLVKVYATMNKKRLGTK